MTKNKIKEVALKLFARKGYEQTSLSMIAGEVGIKTPSIYAFYKSKKDLFLTVVHEVFYHHFAYIHRVSANLSNESAEIKLYTILQEMYSYHLREEDKTNFYRRFMMFPPEGLEESIQDEFNKSDLLISNLLEETFTSALNNKEIRDIEINSLIATFLCLMDGLFTQLYYYAREPEALDLRLKMNWQIYWSGIKKR
jgi:TetR/AcrR family transcriptional repressor of cmeABC operon